MNTTQSDIRIGVDVTNPGQFFACCGLLELADRLWGGAEGWFDGPWFHIQSTDRGVEEAALPALLAEISKAPLTQLDPDDDFASPMLVGGPFDLTLNWWKDTIAGGSELKVWTGSMCSVRIARAMQAASRDPALHTDDLLNARMVVFDPDDADNKVEPYYFDSRRGRSANPVDVGFSPNKLDMQTMAYPAVEFLCLVGLQRCRPMPADVPRRFDYYTWTGPCRPCVLPMVVCGVLRAGRARGHQFENAFRTNRKKHKSFLPGNPIGDTQ